MKNLSPQAERLKTEALPLFFLLEKLQSGGPAFIHRVRGLVQDLGPEGVREVDAWMRQDDSSGPRDFQVRLEHLDTFAQRSPVAVALLTCHANGFLRQAALLRLMELGREHVDAVWPFLLVRLNDWVVPVSEAARRAALWALPLVSLEALIRHFPLLEALRSFTRVNHASFLEAAMARLRQPENLEALAPQLDTVRGPSRRVLFQLLWEGPAALARSMVESGLRDRDSVVQRRAVEQVELLFSGEELLRVLGHMEGSRAMFVRREAYALYARKMPTVGKRKVCEALLDPHPAVRDYAQRRLAGIVDIANLYRSAVHDIPLRTGALAGLGETGQASDAPRLAPFLTHPRAAVRREAVNAVGRLDGDGHVSALRERFLDPAPSVSRAAAQALSQRSGRFTADWLRACLTTPGLPPRPHCALSTLVGVLPPFEALEVLLTALDLSDEPSRQWALEALRGWLRTSFRRYIPTPAPERLQALREAVRTARNLPPALAREVDHQLRVFA